MLQLLKEYRTWHSGYGGAMALEDSHLAQASYGPGGMIQAGAEYADYTPEQIERLAKSYEHLENALTVLKGAGPLGAMAYTMLLKPYLVDPGDAAIVERWREIPNDPRILWHDLAVSQLAFYLRNKRLYPIEPKRLTEAEDKNIENQNAEIYANFNRLRNSGLSADEAVRQTAEELRIDVPYVERIIEFRSTLKPRVCVESGCDRKPERGVYCMKHYMQRRRRQERSGWVSWGLFPKSG